MVDVVLEGIVKGLPRRVFRPEHLEFHLVFPFEFRAAYYRQELAESDFVIGLSDLNRGVSEIEISLDGVDYTKISINSLVRAEIEVLDEAEPYISALHFFVTREGKEHRILSYFES